MNNSRFYCVVAVQTNLSLTSSHTTFIDITDVKSFQVILETNVPLVQVHDVIDGTNSPSWNYTNPMIVPHIYINSSPIDLSSSSISVMWTKQDGLSDPIPTSESDGEYIISKKLKLVGDGILTDSTGVVTYICTATYGNQTATAQMTFCRIDSGRIAPALLNASAINSALTSITLSRNIMYYNFLNIYYHDVFGLRNSIRIRNANISKITAKLSNDVLAGGSVSAVLTIDGTSALMPNATNIMIDTDGNITQSTADNGFITIDAIYGE